MKKRLLLAASLALVCFGFWYLSTLRRSNLPYADRFSERNAMGWVVMGGNWQFDGDAVVNRSDEHGAKLVTGSGEWGDISLDADLKLIGHAGDVGVLVRVNNAEPGVDAYDGYYVGLRSDDRSLVIGRADYGWMEGRPTPIAGGVIADRWYHLRVVAVGCVIGAEATDTITGESTYGMLQEQNCVVRGKIGIRSMATGGAWKRIVVRSANTTDLAPIRRQVSYVQTPHFVFREGDINRAQVAPAIDEARGDVDGKSSTSHITNIEAIKMHGADSQNPVTIRGVVTLLSPLYVQDSTGGIAVEASGRTVLNLGDEVEVIGTIKSQDDKVSFSAHNVKLTGDRTLIPPSSVTSTQAAGILFRWPIGGVACASAKEVH